LDHVFDCYRDLAETIPEMLPAMCWILLQILRANPNFSGKLFGFLDVEERRKEQIDDKCDRQRKRNFVQLAYSRDIKSSFSS
jgi:hypothetical protein